MMGKGFEKMVPGIQKMVAEMEKVVGEGSSAGTSMFLLKKGSIY